MNKNNTLGQTARAGRMGPSLGSSFKSLQVRLRSFLAQLLSFAVFMGFALGLRGWKILMSN